MPHAEAPGVSHNVVPAQVIRQEQSGGEVKRPGLAPAQLRERSSGPNTPSTQALQPEQRQPKPNQAKANQAHVRESFVVGKHTEEELHGRRYILKKAKRSERHPRCGPGE